MRSQKDVYPEIIKEIYIWFFVKKIGAYAHIKHLLHITQNFPLDSPSKIFANSIEINQCHMITDQPKS